ncbi:hypothetical protein D3C81_176030 [compost metagenome]
MASSYEKKLTPEQVRASYRERFFVADLLPPILVDRLNAQGLIHSEKAKVAIKVDIPLWDERPPFAGPVNVLTLEWLPSSSSEWQRVAPSEDIPDDSTLPGSDFPLKRSIPLDIFSTYEGLFKFRYTVSNWNSGGERISPTINVIIDRTGPKWVDPESAMISVAEPVITDAVLTRDGGVKCVIPEFLEENDKDETMVAVAWLDRMPAEGEDINKFIVLYRALPTNREVLVPADKVTIYGSKTHYAIALLIDKAGNRGELSLPATVQVALGTLPSGLKDCTVPLADDGLIDRPDAAFPTKVHIESYTGYDSNDGIVVKWGKTTLARTSVGAHLPFPLKITVPWLLMVQEYDFASTTHVQPVDVDYQVLRGDYPFAPPNGITVDTDLSIPKPGHPDPDPIDPTLNLIEFLSSKGSDSKLTEGDIGEDATASVELFDRPNVGDTLTLYYKGDVVDSPDNPYVVDGSETPKQVIHFVIPWEVIELTPVMDDLPLYYTLTHADFGNPLESNRTIIDVLVEVVDLPEPEFPGTLINCNHLREKTAGSGEWGIFIHIPTSTHLKEGAEVTPKWQTYELDGTTLLPGTDHSEDLTVSLEQEQNGIDWFVPYTKCLKPTYRPPVSAGMGKMEYSITVRGNPVPSGTIELYVAVFETDGGSGNDHCVIPRP